MQLLNDIDSLDHRDENFLAAVMHAIDPFFKTWFRPEVRGLHNVPDGAALFVGNHNGGLLSADTFILAAALYRAHGLRGLPYGLAHEVALGVPGLQHFLLPLGAVRASHKNAHALFARGDKVMVYPGGDLEAMRPYSKRNEVVFGPRRGYIKLALGAGVPIVPVVAHGAHSTFIVLSDNRWLAKMIRLQSWARLRVLPLTFSLPWGFVLGITPPYFPLPTRITVEILPPMHFERSGEDAANDDAYVEACHQRVIGAIQEKLTQLAVERGD